MWLNEVVAIGPPLFSNAATRRAHCHQSLGPKNRACLVRHDRDSLFRRVLLSLSQKLIVPSDPAVAKVPYGWNWMSFTAYTADDLDGAGSSFRWHCTHSGG